jgi:hypothetical protein
VALQRLGPSALVFVAPLAPAQRVPQGLLDKLDLPTGLPTSHRVDAPSLVCLQCPVFIPLYLLCFLVLYAEMAGKDEHYYSMWLLDRILFKSNELVSCLNTAFS